jgi:uncharacterized protein (UPF0548 family)
MTQAAQLSAQQASELRFGAPRQDWNLHLTDEKSTPTAVHAVLLGVLCAAQVRCIVQVMRSGHAVCCVAE